MTYYINVSGIGWKKGQNCLSSVTLKSKYQQTIKRIIRKNNLLNNRPTKNTKKNYLKVI